MSGNRSKTDSRSGGAAAGIRLNYRWRRGSRKRTDAGEGVAGSLEEQEQREQEHEERERVEPEENEG